MSKGVNAAVGAVGLISCLCCFLFLAYIAYVFWRDKKGAADIEVKLLKSQFGQLFFSLIAGDLISALGFALCFAWIDQGGRAPVAGPGERADILCTFQAVAITAGDLASGLFSLSVAMHTCVILCTDWRPSWSMLWAFIAAMWLLVLLVEVIPPFTVDTARNGPFYNGVGFWCFSANAYQYVRLANHYIFIYISAFGSMIIYAFTSWHIYRHYKRAAALGLANDKIQLSSAMRIMLFPCAYWVVVLPLAGYRLAQMSGASPNDGALAFAGLTFASSGAINVVLYSTTRNILQFSWLKSSRTRFTNFASATQAKSANGQVSVQVQTQWFSDGSEHEKAPKFEMAILDEEMDQTPKFTVDYAMRISKSNSTGV